MQGLSKIATYDYHEAGIDFYTREVVQSGTYTWQKSVTTPLLVECISSRIAEEAFVAGLDPLTNEIVIERWSYSPPTGSLASSHSISPSAQGQSIDLLDTDISIVGGTFIPPSQRTLPQPSKQTIYRGGDFSGIHSMSVDPEGRFLLLQDSSSFEVYQLFPGNPPVAIVSQDDYPEIDGTYQLQAPYQLGTLDRVYIVGGWPQFGGTQKIVFHDPDNDGTFDPPINLTHKEFYEAYPGEGTAPANPWKFMN